MARIKHVFKDYQECAHVWASQTQAEGRSHGHRLYFEGPSIYSYGSHFEIARMVKPGKRSPAVVLFTDRDYGPTTSRHKSYVRDAVTHLPVFTVGNFGNLGANADGYLSDINSAIESLKRSYSVSWRLESIQKKIKEANAYLRWFGKSVTPSTRRAIKKHFRNVDAILTKEERAKIDEREKKQDERTEKARATRRKNDQIRWAQREAENAERQRKREEKERIDREKLPADLEAWKAGATVDNEFFYDAPIMLRVVGDEIETSRSARIPLMAARKFWRRFLSGERAEVGGMRLGHYTVDSLDGETLTVGCHEIPVAELHRIAAALGWTNGVPFEVSEVLQ